MTPSNWDVFSSVPENPILEGWFRSRVSPCLFPNSGNSRRTSWAELNKHAIPEEVKVHGGVEVGGKVSKSLGWGDYLPCGQSQELIESSLGFLPLPWLLVPSLLLKSPPLILRFSSVQPLSRVWLFSTPWIAGFPVHHQLPEFTQTHVHWVSDAIQPSHPLSSPSPPAPNPSQHQGLFQWVSSLNQVAKVLEFQLQHQSFYWIFRTDFL